MFVNTLQSVAHSQFNDFLIQVCFFNRTVEHTVNLLYDSYYISRTNPHGDLLDFISPVQSNAEWVSLVFTLLYSFSHPVCLFLLQLVISLSHNITCFTAAFSYCLLQYLWVSISASSTKDFSCLVVSCRALLFWRIDSKSWGLLLMDYNAETFSLQTLNMFVLTTCWL